MIYVGINLHSNNMVNITINSNVEVVREAKLPTSTRGWYGMWCHSYFTVTCAAAHPRQRRGLST